MEASADRPQIGRIDVDRPALDEAGAELGTVLDGFEFAVSIAGIPDGTPTLGWRVLARPESVVVLGAPVDDGSKSWRIAQVAPPREPGGIAHLSVHPDPLPLRPSRAERARGLVLRWPDVTRSELDLDHLAVDVVNTGDRRWRPDDDSFVAIGFMTRAGEKTGAGYFAFAGGQPPGFALDPGEYARIHVRLDENQWRDREPGRHEVSAMLIELGVRTETPLEVHLTPELIEQHRARVERARPPARERRRALEGRLDGLRALVDARARLGIVVEKVLDATTDEEVLLGVREVLDCTQDAARIVSDTPLLRFGAASMDRVAHEAEILEREVERAEDGRD